MPEFYVILVEPKYGGNIGSVARLIKNFGMSGLVMVNPPEESSEMRAMAMHARDVLDGAGSAASIEEAREKYGFDYLVATTAIVANDGNSRRNPVYPEDLACALDSDAKVGLVFGREDHGLSNEELELCDFVVTIPADPVYPTMNLSHSVAVILYVVSRERMKSNLKEHKKFRRMGKDENRVLLEMFDDFASPLYENDFELSVLKRTFRQLIGRAFLSAGEASTLIGVFRHGLRERKRLEKQIKEKEKGKR